MTKRIIEIEDESLQRARSRVQSQIPKGFCLLSEEVVSGSEAQTIRVIADTVETARERARSKLPVNAIAVEEKVRITPKHRVITLEAFDERTARETVKRRHSKTARVYVRLKTEGRRGFLGIGRRKPSSYEVTIVEYAVVEVTYKERARIRVAIIPRGQIPEALSEMITHIEEGWSVGDESARFLDILRNVGADVLPALMNTLKRKEGNKWPAGSALCWASSMYAEIAVPMLIGLLSCGDPAVAYMAREILNCLGCPKAKRAVDTYEKALNKMDDVGRNEMTQAIIQSILENSVARLNKAGVTTKLLWLSSQTKYLGPGGLGFVLARDIGQRLYDLGGHGAMTAAYRRVASAEHSAEMKGKTIPGDAASLNWVWAGIGSWVP